MNDLEMLECSMGPSDQVEPTIKDQLIKCISSGQSKNLLGKEMKVGDLDKLTSIETEYATYKSRLASAMTKSLGDSMIRAYSHVACMVLGIQGTEKKLTEDLSGDLFLNCAVRDLSCNLYYKFGAWISPISVGMITGKHYLENRPTPPECKLDAVHPPSVGSMLMCVACGVKFGFLHGIIATAVGYVVFKCSLEESLSWGVPALAGTAAYYATESLLERKNNYIDDDEPQT